MGVCMPGEAAEHTVLLHLVKNPPVWGDCMYVHYFDVLFNYKMFT